MENFFKGLVIDEEKKCTLYRCIDKKEEKYKIKHSDHNMLIGSFKIPKKREVKKSYDQGIKLIKKLYQNKQSKLKMMEGNRREE